LGYLAKFLLLLNDDSKGNCLNSEPFDKLRVGPRITVFCFVKLTIILGRFFIIFLIDVSWLLTFFSVSPISDGLTKVSGATGFMTKGTSILIIGDRYIMGGGTSGDWSILGGIIAAAALSSS
jgi:hypothetical protein